MKKIENNSVKRTTVYIPEKLLIKAKITAVQEGSTLTELIREGLEVVINKKRGRENE